MAQYAAKKANALPQGKPKVFGLSAKFPGRVYMGNIDLNNRKVYHGGEGDYRTENSISIGTDQGEVLIPTVVDGQQLTEDQAIEHFYQTGEHLGIFATPQDADRYAEMLHKRQESFYKGRK